MQMVVALPDGTKHHIDTPARPIRGDFLYLVNKGVGRIDRVLFVIDDFTVKRVDVTLTDWTEFN